MSGNEFLSYGLVVFKIAIAMDINNGTYLGRVVRIFNMIQEPGTGKAGYIMECSRGRPAGKKSSV